MVKSALDFTSGVLIQIINNSVLWGIIDLVNRRKKIILKENVPDVG